MQQSAYEHAALIWTRPSDTIRALRHVSRRIMRPDTCQHPMTRQNQLQKPPLRLGRLHMLPICARRLGDRISERGSPLGDLGDRNLTAEALGHEALTRQFHAAHLRLTRHQWHHRRHSAPARSSRSAQDFIFCDRAGNAGLPRLGILARRDDKAGLRSATHHERDKCRLRLHFRSLVTGFAWQVGRTGAVLRDIR